MTNQEGTIQFAYDLKRADSAVADPELFGQLKSWREVLVRLQLVGQDPARYGGFGFGNLSARDPDRPQEFLITASQTGGVRNLAREHVVRIVCCNVDRFWVDAIGERPPSSETLTHGMIYGSDPRISWIFHAHCPEIWQQAEVLGIPVTGPEVAYGSPGMVTATSELLDGYHSRPLVFATLGHTDGVFSCGPTARDAGGLLVSYLAKALCG